MQIQRFVGHNDLWVNSVSVENFKIALQNFTPKIGTLTGNVECFAQGTFLSNDSRNASRYIGSCGHGCVFGSNVFTKDDAPAIHGPVKPVFFKYTKLQPVGTVCNRRTYNPEVLFSVARSKSSDLALERTYSSVARYV